MFVEAFEKASHFTKPVILSHINLLNQCYAGIGSFVVINSDGWAVTAAHIVNEIERLGLRSEEYEATEKKKNDIYADTSLDQKTRSKLLKSLPKFEKHDPKKCSAWWGFDGLVVKEVFVINHIDLAFVKFENFNSTLVDFYPIFKNPTTNISCGKSLCRIGFPFANVTPTYTEYDGVFHLPPGSIPIPLFPNEGIFTRTVPASINPSLPSPSFDMLYLETSSAGLRGQSGGPIFDINGYIWGIQSQTRHYPLGFSPEVPNGKPGEKEHQFLNIGWGVHIKTIIGAMNELKIKYAVSDK